MRLPTIIESLSSRSSKLSSDFVTISSVYILLKSLFVLPLLLIEYGLIRPQNVLENVMQIPCSRLINHFSRRADGRNVPSS